jgi:hypothetical protein
VSCSQNVFQCSIIQSPVSSICFLRSFFQMLKTDYPKDYKRV